MYAVTHGLIRNRADVTRTCHACRLPAATTRSPSRTVVDSLRATQHGMACISPVLAVHTYHMNFAMKLAARSLLIPYSSAQKCVGGEHIDSAYLTYSSIV